MCRLSYFALETNNAACHALLFLIELAHLIVATARIEVSPAKLLGLVHRFLEAFTAAFGFEWLTPKCHWLLHLPETLKRLGKLLNCFDLERKHRVPKRYATDLQNTSKEASKSLLSEVVCHHLSSLNTQNFDFSIGLVNGRPAPKKSRRLILKALGLEDDGMPIHTSADARFSALAMCRRGDVVLLQDGSGLRAARIQLHCDIADECVSMAQAFKLHRRVPGSALAVWEVGDDPYGCWETNAIVAAVEFCMYPDGKVGTILPIEFL